MHTLDSFLLLHEMIAAAPGELLREALQRAGMPPTELGKRLGYTTPYQTVKRWIDGRGFNAENQRKAAEVLGLPHNYFTQPDLAAARERHRLRVFYDFLRTEIGQATTPEQRRILESTRFPGEILPTANLYAAWALALQERIPFDQVMEVAKENDALDRELEEHRRRNALQLVKPHKPPAKPPKPPRK
jgi:hypothetical protein